MTKCRRCDAKLIDGTKPCGACRADRVEAHVRTLVAGAASTHTRVLKAKADATTALRCLGFSQQQVVEARAQALDGWSVARVLEHLNEDATHLQEVC
jgi:hypothetical protein